MLIKKSPSSGAKLMNDLSSNDIKFIHQITQEQINQFADATLDHQWIHVDAERAKIESPPLRLSAWLPYALPDTLFLETG